MLSEPRHAEASYKVDNQGGTYHIPPVVDASLRALDILVRLKEVAAKSQNISVMVSSDISQQQKDLLSQRQAIFDSAMKHVQDYLSQPKEGKSDPSKYTIN